MARRLVFFLFIPPQVVPAQRWLIVFHVSWLARRNRLEWCWMSSKLVLVNFRRCSPVVEQIGWGQQNQEWRSFLIPFTELHQLEIFWHILIHNKICISIKEIMYLLMEIHNLQTIKIFLNSHDIYSQ